ncbi:DUF3267 domain-containing protein [Sporosarcina highlanderae]|uniref:DUF3267 domain-containing protein n=1 Tax=Sporosarcina highlanderae TaxID=3035916 RepID=A0ABT8JVS8_9BACL|nr:DUF3267 domain-containing protein [Sporosarcina highlanderae]MDN4608908.1 DUF3267 domain-containing protein [Sporosarcina highlanderae]
MGNFGVPDKVIEIDLPKVAKRGLWLSFFSLLALLVLKMVFEGRLSFSITIWSVLYFVVGYVILIVLHELFHLLGFRIFGKVPWKRMIVGLNLKLGIAYATTDVPMTNRAIRRALLLPFWMTGVLPAVIGLVIGDGVLITLAAFLIGGAAGDFAMHKELQKLPDDWLVRDDPELPRLYLFEPNKHIQ